MPLDAARDTRSHRSHAMVRERPTGRQFGKDSVHRLHEVLRELAAEPARSPGSFQNAPGYYVVYFPGDGDGITVEYVHTAGGGEDS